MPDTDKQLHTGEREWKAVGRLHFHEDYEWDATYDDAETLTDNYPMDEVIKVGVLKRMPYQYFAAGKLYKTRREAETALANVKGGV